MLKNFDTKAFAIQIVAVFVGVALLYWAMDYRDKQKASASVKSPGTPAPVDETVPVN